MLFNSFEFLFFLPLVWFAYWSLKNHLRLQNLLVIVASYVFYGWWDWRFRDCEVTYLDYHELPFSVEEWRDGNRLNSHGVVHFTERVRRDVEQLMREHVDEAKEGLLW